MRFWAEAQDLDFSVGIHEGTGGMPAVGVERFRSFGAKHMVSHTMEMMLAALSIIWDGVCERFPKVRVGFLESGGGWMAPWLDRMDRHFEDKGLFNDSSLTMPPSEYFKRQCWISYEPVEGNLTHLVDYIGPHKVLWATDYPHPDGFLSWGTRADCRKATGRTSARGAGRGRSAILQFEVRSRSLEEPAAMELSS